VVGVKQKPPPRPSPKGEGDKFAKG